MSSYSHTDTDKSIFDALEENGTKIDETNDLLRELITLLEKHFNENIPDEPS